MTTAIGRIFWLFVLLSHAAAAAGWGWLAPGGFELSHPRFWTNRAAPAIVLGAVAMAGWASRQGRLGTTRAILVAIPAAWAAGAIASRFAFPATFALLFLIPLFVAAILGTAVVLTFRGMADRSRRPLGLGLAAGLSLGVAMPIAFRPPPAATRPMDVHSPPRIHGVATIAGMLRERTFVSPGDGSATVRVAPLRITVQPLLTFQARSPDGAPTVLVPASEREGRSLQLVGASSSSTSVDLRYKADYEASLHVEDTGGTTRLEATAALPTSIWSHLNGFCDVNVLGHRRLSLAFSPCPDVQIEVRPMDYPFGRPLRFAFLDASGRFRIVEATSGEKGPFRELAAGPLKRGEELRIELFDEGRPIATIVLEDWSSQVDVQLSPTAGWGAPANAIEFCLSGDETTSPASIYISLASTSVGRGWDCVGHRAGTYRNRVRVVPTPETQPFKAVDPR